MCQQCVSPVQVLRVDGVARLQHDLAGYCDQALPCRDVVRIVGKHRVEVVLCVVPGGRRKRPGLQPLVCRHDPGFDLLLQPGSVEFLRQRIDLGTVGTCERTCLRNQHTGVFEPVIANRGPGLVNAHSENQLLELCVQECQARMIRIGKAHHVHDRLCLCVVSRENGAFRQAENLVDDAIEFGRDHRITVGCIHRCKIQLEFACPGNYGFGFRFRLWSGCRCRLFDDCLNSLRIFFNDRLLCDGFDDRGLHG